MKLTPAVVQYLRDEYLVEHMNDIDGLLAMMGHLQHELCTNRSFARTQEGEIQSSFRKEVCILYCIMNACAEGTTPTSYNPDTDAYILEHVECDMHNTEFTDLCTQEIIKKRADTNRTTLEREEVMDLMIGRVLAGFAYEAVRAYGYTTLLTAEDQEPAERFAQILNELARNCQFDSTGDKLLHLCIKPKLCAERLSQLVWTELPLRQIARQLRGDATNDIVFPLIETRACDRATTIDWSTSVNTDDFMFAITLMCEYVQGSYLDVFVNTEIPYAPPDITHPFVMSMNFLPFSHGIGILKNKALTVLDRSVPYPIPTLLLHLARARLAEPTSAIGYKQLVDCCDDPDIVTSDNPFYTKLYPTRDNTGF